MSNRIVKYLAIIVLVFVSLTVGAQTSRFCNLSADDVKIDSILPNMAYSFPLPDNYGDSIYSVSLKYPEFYDMPASDVAAYKAITDALPPAMPEIAMNYVCSRKKSMLVADFCPVVYRDGKYQYLVSYMLELTSQPNAEANARSKAGGMADRYATESVLANGKWAKIRVSTSGIHQLTDALIRKAGFSDPSKVKIYGYGGNMIPETLTADYITSHDDLQEVATCSVNGKRLFYAEGPVSWNTKIVNGRTRNPYSNYGYYFLTETDGDPLTLPETEFFGQAQQQTFYYHSLYEKDEFAWREMGRNLYEGSMLESGKSRDYYIDIPEGNTSATITLSSSFAFRQDRGSSVQVFLNDSLIGTHKVDYRSSEHPAFHVATESYKITHGLKASNKLTIKNTNSEGYRLDYISAAFAKPWPCGTASDNFPEPEYVYRITNQNHHAPGQYDMIIIIPTSQKLLGQAERIKAHHESHDSLTVKIVPADELYNEFSSGTPDISAYKRYMKMLYDRAENEYQMPKSLLLLGDALWDNRLLTTTTKSLNADDFLLCYESENSYSETTCFASDDFCATLDDNETLATGTGIPDIGVGRIPVTTDAKAKAVVDKILYYVAHSHGGSWQNTIAYLGDDGDGKLHMEDLNTVAEELIDLYPDFYHKKIYWDAYTRESSATGHRYPKVTELIKKMQNDGTLIFDYAGHGSPTSLSHEMVLVANDFSEFRGKNYSLWITASCDIMPYDGTGTTIGEEALLNPDGGAVAFYGTTRTVLAPSNKLINRAFLKAVLSTDNNGRKVTLGEANRLAKEFLITTSSGGDRGINKLQYSLLGDPAITLASPQLKTVIDSINGVAITPDVTPKLKAGSIVTLKGHVENGGEKVSGFNGLADILICDVKRNIVCKNNAPKDKDEKPFQYTDYPDVIFQGTDSVSNGEFSFIFAVTKDINYSEGNGLINIYAHNNENTCSAHGTYTNVEVNGSAFEANDSIGPSIYCYLNTPSFVNGGTVNSTPLFVAELTDEDGINASGAGIGHDLSLTIDGLPAKTYSLNDNFQFEFGSYTKGQTYYVIPQLTPGAHSLQFRAWDIHNNPSTTTLSFHVEKDLQPTIARMYATPNPAKDSVTFIVSHDRPGSQVRISIDVMDSSGRLLWTSEEETVQTDSYYTYTWDLTLDSGGRLQTGIYLYRVRLGSGDSEETSLAKKLIVVR